MNSAKGILILFGTAIGALWTVANVVALYYGKVYLFDRPALAVGINAVQFDPTGDKKQLLISLEFDNYGIRPYTLSFEYGKPITIAQVSTNTDKEPQYSIVKRVSFPLVITDLAQQPHAIGEVHELYFAPGEKGKYSTLTAVPGPGIYLVDFGVRDSYKSLLLGWLGEGSDFRIHASAYVHVK